MESPLSRAAPSAPLDPDVVPQSPMERAIAAAGGVVKTAALCGVSPQAVSQWTRVPAAHTAKLAELTGIPAHELRPDVFPAPAPEKAA